MYVKIFTEVTKMFLNRPNFEIRALQNVRQKSSFISVIFNVNLKKLLIDGLFLRFIE